MDKANMFWQTYLNLENETLEVAKYILSQILPQN